MLFASEKIVKSLFEDLSKLKLNSELECEYRNLYFDQLGTSINYGGRGILAWYLFAMYFLPKMWKSMPAHLVRVPMAVLLLMYGESIYFFGADVSIRFTSHRIMKQMLDLPEGFQLRRFAIELNK